MMEKVQTQAQALHLLLFGDQAIEKLSSIQALVRNSKTNPAAKRFLQEATDVLQLEFSKLSRVEHGWTQNFDTLLGLAEENSGQEGNVNIMVATMLMCIGRLGDLVVRAARNPAILGTSQDPVQVLGFCTGLLPASVVIAARNPSDLFLLSREIISITFRMAFQGRCQMHLIECESLNGTWARTYVGLKAEEAQRILDDFHQSQNIPKPRKIAVGVVSKTWVTLCGAPSSLDRLQAWSAELEKVPSMNTDSGGPVHTPYQPTINVDQILQDSRVRDLPLDWSKARLLSPSRCEEYRHATFGELLADIVHDVMHKILRVSDIIDACVEPLGTERSVEIAVVGPTSHQPAVEQVLKKRCIPYYEEPSYTPARGLETTAEARGGSDLVAVVGMSGRFPGNDTIEGFWMDLLAGKEHIKKVPKSRFDLDVFYDPTGKKKNSTTAQHGAWLDEPGLFDHRLFNVSPREAAQMDPMVRLALTTSYEALESAGYFPGGTPATQTNRIATFLGQTGEDWHEVLNNEGIDIYYVPSTCRAFGPGQLNYHFKFGGGAFALDSACASSTTAISLACSALIARECDTALAGGGSVLVSPNSFSGLSKAGMLSTTGGCRTYHDDADGYARGEAVAMVVLKRVEDAVADNDNILGVIRGSTRTYSDTATSITHPSCIAQQRVYSEVLRHSGLEPAEIAYVEMHGTGTQAGDQIEMESVVNTMGQNRSSNNPLLVGAVKASVGHGEAAAGVTSLIKVLMMLRERMVPPQPGWPFTLNRNFPPLNKLNITIPAKHKMELRASPRGDDRIKVLVNSLDASGGNTSLAVEEAPAAQPKKSDPRGAHVITISARTLPALQRNRERLLDYLVRNPHTKLADLAYTTTARRMHEVLRVGYVGKTTRDIERQLRDGVARSQNGGGDGHHDPKTKIKKSFRVFLFTGQGAQYAGMGGGLFRTNAFFANTLLGYQSAAVAMGLPPFLAIIADEDRVGAEDMTARWSATQVQLASVALEMALTQLLKTWGVVPDVAIGHSLGEYAALYAAGVLSVSDVLYLVGRRAMLMEEHLTPNTYGMLSTGLNTDSLRKTIETLGLASCNIACINAPSSTVASGTVEDLSVLQYQIQQQGYEEGSTSRTTLLKVRYGFHSCQIDPILDEYQDLSRGAMFAKADIPIISTLTGTLDSEFSPAYLACQARKTVNFAGALCTAQEAGFVTDNTLFIEIGPDPVGLGLARRTLEMPPSTRFLPTLKPSEDNWITVSGVLKAAYETGGSINWPEVHRGYKDSLRLLDLPKYAFDNKTFWTSYANPVPVLPTVVDTKMEPLKSAGFPTSSVQRVESENIDEEGKKITVIFSSDLNNVALLQAIEGHVVNNHRICPTCVYTDIALTAAEYAHFLLHRLAYSGKAPTIHDFVMLHALAIVPGKPKPTLYVTTTYVAANKAADIVFHSRNDEKEVTHGTCRVHFDDSSEVWRVSQAQTLFLLQARMEALREQVTSGKAYRIPKPIVYKLFSTVVDYGEHYHALEEVILDAESRDALGTVWLPSTCSFPADKDHFLFDPYSIDAVTHLAGFVLNSGLRYGGDIACISVGFDAWHELEKLNRDKMYTSYVCMQEVPGGPFIAGDCYVFDAESGHLVQATTGIKFQKLKKIVLDMILGVPAPAAEGGEFSTAFARMEKASIMATSQAESTDKLFRKAASTPPASRPPVYPDILDTVLGIVAAESGCSMEDLIDDNATFADLGVDSLMAITILAVVKRETGLDLDAGFFIEHDTIGTAKHALLERYGTDDIILSPPPPSGQKKLATPDKWTPSASTANSASSSAFASESMMAVSDMINQAAHRLVDSSTSLSPSRHISKLIHLQGPRTPDATKLFLIADETGSALGYIPLPSLGPNLCVYGVESPFAEEPTAFDVGVTMTQLAALFAAGIRQEQSHGPYLIGGVSVGATLAFEVARALLKEGESVSGLLLLDPADGELLEEFLAAGSAGVTKAIQKEHMNSVLQVLKSYRPVPLAVQLQKSVLVVREQALGKVERDWKVLVPRLVVQQVKGVNGSLLRFPALNTFGQICKDALTILRD